MKCVVEKVKPLQIQFCCWSRGDCLSHLVYRAGLVTYAKSPVRYILDMNIHYFFDGGNGTFVLEWAEFATFCPIKFPYVSIKGYISVAISYYPTPKPYVVGICVRLSGQGEKPDICDHRDILAVYGLLQAVCAVGEIVLS